MDYKFIEDFLPADGALLIPVKDIIDLSMNTLCDDENQYITITYKRQIYDYTAKGALKNGT